jgi:GTP-binding protein EngB required for normal cell division
MKWARSVSSYLKKSAHLQIKRRACLMNSTKHPIKETKKNIVNWLELQAFRRLV